jgi:EAL domain-containing protein (putative c-di-GMP-specific phosphodiesterase class I)/CHASE2 domain-containing sensor protein/GGDEF domain-containing protein
VVSARDFPRLARRAALSGLLWIMVGLALALSSGILRPLEDGLSKLRFDLLHRAPSQQITVVEIDVPSLRAAGHWPWGRDRFATAIANLQNAGAKVVGFDVDFSARSSTAADQALADAVARRPGAVILPTFVQPVVQANGEARMVETSPLRGVAQDALLASVNIPIDDDGRVRRYQYGFGRDEAYRHSMAAALSEAPGQRADSFLIDYSVKTAQIPHLSFEDVYENRFDAAKVKGRAILIGATALELGDEFGTIQSATTKGVYIHALAFENLIAGRALIEPSALVVFLLGALLVFLLRPTRDGSTLQQLMARHAAAAVASLGLPFVIQAVTPLSLPMAPLLFAQGLCLVWATRRELERRARAIVDEREAGLLHLAMHEPETGMPNRRALIAAIGAVLDDAPGAIAVVALGIDRHTQLRGALGFNLYNQIICNVAARFCLANDCAEVAHLSISILGMVVRGADRDEVAAKLAALADLQPGYDMSGTAVDAFVRLGVAYADAGVNSERLLEQASLALDRARRDDDRIVTFDHAAQPDPNFNLALMSDMRAGMAADQLSLHFQPKLSLGDGVCHGVEALVRWSHPTRGNIRPDTFIGIAEETGAIRELTGWTLDRAMRDGAGFRERGIDLLISVNISGRLLSDPAFCQHVLDMVRGRNHRLCLEITETAVIANSAAAAAAIAAFRGEGLKISIDDYGVGLSSVSYLKMLDADELKIDKSLVEAVAQSERDRAILKSTIDLAHTLGMKVVAEGVETPEVQAALHSLGADMIQGYLIAKPLPGEALVAFLENARATRIAAE